jgi:hypothetical protein
MLICFLKSILELNFQKTNLSLKELFRKTRINKKIKKKEMLIYFLRLISKLSSKNQPIIKRIYWRSQD